MFDLNASGSSTACGRTAPPAEVASEGPTGRSPSVRDGDGHSDWRAYYKESDPSVRPKSGAAYATVLTDGRYASSSPPVLDVAIALEHLIGSVRGLARRMDECFRSSPVAAGSREESVQVVLEELLLGLKPAWFTPYPPTARGRAVLEQVWRRAFGDNPDVPIGSLISEYELPVPIEWRTEIGYTYRCPDLACFAGQHLLLIELKTERSSYSRQQLVDYLRLARRMNPGAHIDLLLLAGHRPHAQLELGERQRYAEMTWDELADILSSEHGTRAAAALCHFIAESLMTSPATATPDAAVEQAPVDDQVLTAVDQALRIAAALEENARSRSIARGIDVPFPSTSHARNAGTAVRAALAGAGYARVTTWLWQTSSGGQPTTPAGHSTGMELRLAPTRQ